MESGTDMFHRLEQSLCIYPTGSQNLDELLDGGIWTGEVMEIVGPESAGKTQEIGSLLSRVLIQRPTDSHELLQCLELAKTFLASENNKNLRVLMVDSAGSVLALTVQASGWHTQAVISRQLKQIASEFAVAVIVINYIVFPWKDNPRPALGQWWASLAHTRIGMTKEDQMDMSGVVRVKLLKCVRKSVGAKVCVRISKRGLVDVEGPEVEVAEEQMEAEESFNDYKGGSPIF